MSPFIKRKISIVKSDYKLMILGAIFYLSGIIIGVICFKNKGNNGVFIKNVFSYYNQILNSSISPFSILLTRILVNAGYILIVFALSFTVFTYPLILMLLAYRGAIIGCALGIFVSYYGFNGGAIFFTVTLPQNLLVTLGIILSAVFNFDYIVNKKTPKCLDISVIISNCILGLIIATIGAIYEFLITIVLIRPMNFYF